MDFFILSRRTLKMNECLLSIITINLNDAKGLKRSYNSIKCRNRIQTEWIVIDGCSSDGSIDLIKTLGSEIDKVQIEKDDGIYDAMNKGITQATGKYLYFLNSGDVFSEDGFLNESLPILQRSRCKLVSGKVRLMLREKNLGEVDLKPWVPHQGVFVPLDLMKKYKFDTSFKIFGDLDLWYRLKSDGVYKLDRYDYVVAEMSVDGVSANLTTMKKRVIDKAKLNLKHKLYFRLLFDVLQSIPNLFVRKVLGDDFFFEKFLKFRSLLKKSILKFYLFKKLFYG